MTETIDFRVRLPLELRPNKGIPEDYTLQYDRVLNLSENRDRGIVDLEKDMAESRTSHAVIHAEYEFGDDADALNEAVAKMVADDPEKYSGYGTVSMEHFRIPRALHQVERVKELGLHGVSLQPSFFDMAIDARPLYPVYAKANELGLHVALHTGINYTVTYPIRNDQPVQLDQVACDFPDLVLIACHAGWPWVAEMVAVMRKHPTVFAEFGGLAPRYVCEQNTGWEVMFRFMNTLLADQVLHGTDWPVFPMQKAVDQWKAGGLREKTLRGVLGANAARLLGRTP
ncbi:MAG: amidohydrolase family protein [Nitrospiraceae bacterium]|nr:amidohydrolase family protein [Nitrospiraceae bacterium]